jgi:hypothetical protein
MGRIRADVLERLCWCAEIALLEVETLEEWEIWLRIVRNLEELLHSMPSGNGSNGVGAGADATAQRKRGAQSHVFGAPRGRIYPPCPGAAQRGVSVRFVPEPAPGAQSTADYPQPVPDPLPAARVGSGGVRGPVRWTGGG